MTKNTKFNFLKNLKIFPMKEISRPDKLTGVLNFKMSNMNMSVIIKFTTIKGPIVNSSWIDGSKLNNYTLPTFTRKIFRHLNQYK